MVSYTCMLTLIHFPPVAFSTDQLYCSLKFQYLVPLPASKSKVHNISLIDKVKDYLKLFRFFLFSFFCLPKPLLPGPNPQRHCFKTLKMTSCEGTYPSNDNIAFYTATLSPLVMQNTRNIFAHFASVQLKYFSRNRFFKLQNYKMQVFPRSVFTPYIFPISFSFFSFRLCEWRGRD